MKRTLTIIGCVLWIAGLALSITGMNIPAETGQWMTVTGNIAFFAGLGIIGVIWIMKKKEEKEP